MKNYLQEAQERAKLNWKKESEQEAFIAGVQWLIMQPEIVKLCNLHDVSNNEVSFCPYCHQDNKCENDCGEDWICNNCQTVWAK